MREGGEGRESGEGGKGLFDLIEVVFKGFDIFNGGKSCGGGIEEKVCKLELEELE